MAPGTAHHSPKPDSAAARVPPGRVRLGIVFVVCVAGLFGAAAIAAAGPILHERFAPNPSEDLALAATTPSGRLPLAQVTESGAVSAPDTLSRGAVEAEIYGGSHTPSSPDASFHLDRLTTRPDSVRYDEPFRPSLLPFKRLYAFDRVETDFSLAVADVELRRVSVGGMVEDDEDAFFADFSVDARADVPVRIPSPGPGARIVAMEVEPPLPVVVAEDGAENWFLTSEATSRLRVIMQVSIQRSTFGSSYPPIAWSVLAGKAPELPPSVASRADEVLAELGLSSAGSGRPDSPAHAVRILVDHFRRFRDSSELPTSEDVGDLYVELSLGQKGVCRHRAFAFVVTALAAGLPARLVHNEAHAWVEVFDGELWHRIDLGGAPARLDETRFDPSVPLHRPPSDPFTWPEGANSGSSLAHPSRHLASPDAGSDDDDGAAPRSVPRARDSGSSGWPSARATTAPGLAAPPRAPSSGAPSDVVIRLAAEEARLGRGHPLTIHGEVTRQGVACPLARVDLFLLDESGRGIPIGSVATDRKGHFRGRVTVTRDVAAGRHELVARLGGGCH